VPTILFNYLRDGAKIIGDPLGSNKHFSPSPTLPFARPLLVKNISTTRAWAPRFSGLMALGVDVERSAAIGMAQQLLHDLDVDTTRLVQRREGMAEGVPAYVPGNAGDRSASLQDHVRRVGLLTIHLRAAGYRSGSR